MHQSSRSRAPLRGPARPVVPIPPALDEAISAGVRPPSMPRTAPVTWPDAWPQSPVDWPTGQDAGSNRPSRTPAASPDRPPRGASLPGQVRERLGSAAAGMCESRSIDVRYKHPESRRGPPSGMDRRAACRGRTDVAWFPAKLPVWVIGDCRRPAGLTLQDRRRIRRKWAKLSGGGVTGVCRDYPARRHCGP